MTPGSDAKPGGSPNISISKTRAGRDVIANIGLDEAQVRNLAVALVRDGVESQQKIAAQSLLVDRRRPWDATRFAPSALLRAEYGVVAFQGRQALLAEIHDWGMKDVSTALRLYVAPGGMGKTRLMIELCQQFRAKGWQAGFLDTQRNPSPDELTALLSHAEGTLVVVDYAETSAVDVRRLLESSLSSAARVRIVLLARAVADWWYGLQRDSGGVGDFLQGPNATRHELPPLAEHDVVRHDVFRHAEASYAATLHLDTPDVPPPNLAAACYDRVLFIHLRALAGLNQAVVDSESALLDFALRREESFWDAGVTAAGLSSLSGRPVRQAAALLTLAGKSASHADALRILTRVPLLAGQPAAVLGRVAEVFHQLYPAEAWLEGIQPDLLGEHLVGRAVEDDPALLGIFAGE